MRRFPSRPAPRPPGNFAVGLQLPPSVPPSPPAADLVLQWVFGFGSGYSGDDLTLFPWDFSVVETEASLTLSESSGRIDFVSVVTAFLRGAGVDVTWSVTFEPSGEGGAVKAVATSVAGPVLTLALGQVFVDAVPSGYEDIFVAGGTYSVTATTGGRSYGPITWLIDVPPP